MWLWVAAILGGFAFCLPKITRKRAARAQVSILLSGMHRRGILGAGELDSIGFSDVSAPVPALTTYLLARSLSSSCLCACQQEIASKAGNPGSSRDVGVGKEWKRPDGPQ